jgi:hypothetical protein
MTTSKRNGLAIAGVMIGLGIGATAWHSTSATASETATPIAEYPAPATAEQEGDEGSSALQLQLQLAGAIEGCGALLPAGAQGTTRFAANVLADPELGAVVDSVVVLDDGIGETAFNDCVLAATTSAELGDDSIVGEVRFRYSAGAPADNAREFLAAHPALVDQYPQLSAIRDRAPDAPRSDDDATTFATVLASDGAALAAFEQWSVDQGIDLSGVRAEG